MPRPYYPVFRDHCISLVVYEYNASGFSGAGTDYEREAMDHDRLLDRGIDSPGHYFFVIVGGEDPEVLGEIWLGHVEKMEAGSVFLFYLCIGDDFRHQGIGRVAMRLVEEKMTAVGFDTINLHVFLRNEAAISLYEKSGYNLSREYEIGRFYQKRMGHEKD